MAMTVIVAGSAVIGVSVSISSGGRLSACPGKLDTGFPKKDMRQRKNLERIPIQPKRDALRRTAARVTVAAALDTLCPLGESRKMPAVDEDDRPKKKIGHEIGQDLTLLSVSELADRIGVLKDEIARLEAEMARKRATQTAADAFFKK